ncbi:MAG: hypothetical protein IPP46_06045 [Bacteroidetes bacterium]|nr:hypothetical protein [Bacteroidota bacterium]
MVSNIITVKANIVPGVLEIGFDILAVPDLSNIARWFNGFIVRIKGSLNKEDNNTHSCSSGKESPAKG